jgi:hypothetical protein
MLTSLQIPEEDWLQTPASVRTALLTLQTTLRQQGREVLDYLTAAGEAAGVITRPDWLLPDSS